MQTSLPHPESLPSTPLLEIDKKAWANTQFITHHTVRGIGDAFLIIPTQTVIRSDGRVKEERSSHHSPLPGNQPG